jgi:hypothetical protein
VGCRAQTHHPVVAIQLLLLLLRNPYGAVSLVCLSGELRTAPDATNELGLAAAIPGKFDTVVVAAEERAVLAVVEEARSTCPWSQLVTFGRYFSHSRARSVGDSLCLSARSKSSSRNGDPMGARHIVVAKAEVGAPGIEQASKVGVGRRINRLFEKTLVYCYTIVRTRECWSVKRAGLRTLSTIGNLIPSCPITTATPRIFGFDPRSQGTVLPAFGRENSPSSVQGGPLS